MIRIITVFIPFLIFGLLCILGNIVFIFFLITNLYKIEKIKYVSRYMVMVSWRFFINLIKYLGWIHFPKMNLDVKGSSNIIIANHPTLIDVVFLLSYIKGGNCVVKKELKRNLFLYPAIKCCGYILNENNDKFINKCINVLKQGENLIIFPEGTRTVDKINMHKGAAYIAIHGASILKPYFVNVFPKCLGKYDKWYYLPKDLQYNIIKLQDIIIESFEENKPNPVRVRKLHSELKNMYDNISNNII